MEAMEAPVINEADDKEQTHLSTGSQEIKTTEEPGDPGRTDEPEDNTTRTSNILNPEDVLCDSCIESPCRALKSCLTCLVSYCEVHLRPHLENSKFQNHRLVEPLQDIECRTCDVHQLPLELYCQTDGCCVCRDCEGQQHQEHTTLPVGEARRQIETELQKKQGEITKTISAAENAIDKLQSNNVSIENSVAEVRAVIEQQFSLLQAAVVEARRGAAEVLGGEQRQALRQVEGIQAHLEQRKAELKKTLARVEKLSRKKTDVDFLQEYSEWKKRSVDMCLPGVYIGLIDRLASFSLVVTESTQELCDQLLSTYRDKLKEICKSEKLGIKTMVHADMSEAQPLSLPDPETREDFLKYASNLSFDPDTTHKFLRLTKDNRKVTNTSPWQHTYPDTPTRFEYWRQVMTSESLYLGRHYFEVEMSGEKAHVGLTYKSIDRKGEESSSCITGNDFSWCLGRTGRGFSAWHDNVEALLEASTVTRIGVYIDFEKGSIAFYGVTETVTLLYKYKADFMEPLCPTVWLSKKDNVVSLVSPRDLLPLKSSSMTLTTLTPPPATLETFPESTIVV